MPLDATVIYNSHNYLTGVTTPSPYGTIVKGRGLAGNMTDTVTADYKRKSARGEIINNDVVSERFDVDYPARGYANRNRRWNTSNVLDQDFGATTSSSISGHEWLGQYMAHESGNTAAWLASVTAPSVPSTSQLLVDALAKASSSDAMVLVSMAEARKTLDSVVEATKVMSRLRNWIGALSPKDFTPSGALRLAGNGLRVWLEVRYGLLPTYYDILGYAKVIQKRGLKARVRFSSYADGSIASTPVDSSSNSNFYQEFRKVVRFRRTEVRAGCLVEPYATEIGAIYSLGIDRISSTAWELVPFSFVVDWFFNTAGYIAAHEGRFGQRVLASWTSIKESVVTNASMSTVGNDHFISGQRHQGIYTRNFTAREEYTRFVRNADPEIPVLPSFQLNLNWKKCVDLVALAASVRKSLGRLRL